MFCTFYKIKTNVCVFSFLPLLMITPFYLNSFKITAKAGNCNQAILEVQFTGDQIIYYLFSVLSGSFVFSLSKMMCTKYL